MAEYFKYDFKATKYLYGQTSLIKQFKNELKKVIDKLSYGVEDISKCVFKCNETIREINTSIDKKNLSDGFRIAVSFFDNISDCLKYEDMFLYTDFKEALIFIKEKQHDLSHALDEIELIIKHKKPNTLTFIIARFYKKHGEELLQLIRSQLLNNKPKTFDEIKEINVLVYRLKSWLYPIIAFANDYKPEQKEGSGSGSLIIILLILAIIVIIFCIISFFTNPSYDYYPNKLISYS